MSENIQQAVNQGEIELNIVRSGNDQLAMLGRLLPYLQTRYEAALKWRKAYGEDKKSYEEFIARLNENIKSVLYL